MPGRSIGYCVHLKSAILFINFFMIIVVLGGGTL
jgi:hypothetical protein